MHYIACGTFARLDPALDVVLSTSIIPMACSGCDWDPQKNLENQRKYEDIRFGDACCIFDDPYREETEDDGDYD